MFEKKKEKYIEYQRSLIEQHYKEIENIYTQMRAWRHDYHNHIQALYAYLMNGGDRESYRFSR